MVSVEIIPRSKNLAKAKTSAATLPDLIQFIAKQNKINPNRLRLTHLPDDKSKKHVPVNVEKSFAENQLDAQTVTVYVKDLGPQIPWRNVFMTEYAGPLFIHPLIYFYGGRLYGSTTNAHSATQTTALVLVMLHFLKREWETVYVHSFSLATMPAFNIFKNSFHYWGLSGVLLGLFIYAPVDTDSGFFTHTANHSTLVQVLLVAFWAYAEVSNGVTHLTFKHLRSDGSKDHKIPYGYGFDLVSCPNYFFESLAWLAFSLLVNNWSSYLFLVVSTGQMWLWAVKKHQRYRKEFGATYPRRKIMVPFVA
ncbi:hypothetical protein BABINDRAFT_160604 [Babjeviella inositovora NRRL Y-12698]|uniref:3-oxo-5-alpha-steroid 4-dehydrogenase C-terminal domain-containing protein n=1 Tax=Babjeviella inositovora NRRL Y-12698 TaxID=984486 RepID=A0A1E3QU68_9ASCO|nr:uncharacterized protein BABINDRAFT_160604 [Babjeviella inositovora NRRL Y-12698]ODQ81219.1 hypothetical protein BABINDRAFT_160604 [Babjeviella inositovora NRRL Y-12698]